MNSNRRACAVQMIAATAICVVGFLTVSTVAHARPPIPLAPICADWVIGAGQFQIKQDNGILVRMDGWDGKLGTGKHIEYDLDFEFLGFPPEVTTGTVTDGAIRGNSIDFTAKWDSKSWSNHYWGTIGDNGYASGTTEHNGVEEGWRSVVPAACAPAPNYSAISYWLSDEPGFTSNWGSAKDYSTAGAAAHAAQSHCTTGGRATDKCDTFVVPDDGRPCVAVGAGVRTDGLYGGGPDYGPDPQSAEAAARQGFSSNVGVASVCAATHPTGVLETGSMGSFPPPPGPPSQPSEITLRFDDPVLLPLPGVVARVGISNNAGKSTVGCDFVSPFPAHFTVTGDAITQVGLPLPAKGITYNVTVTCDGIPTHNELKTF